jgi:hypothetical protein
MHALATSSVVLQQRFLMLGPGLQAVLRELSAEELGQLLWALTSLRVRPQEEWMDDYMAGGWVGAGTYQRQGW